MNDISSTTKFINSFWRNNREKQPIPHLNSSRPKHNFRLQIIVHVQVHFKVAMHISFSWNYKLDINMLERKPFHRLKFRITVNLTLYVPLFHEVKFHGVKSNLSSIHFSFFILTVQEHFNHLKILKPSRGITLELLLNRQKIPCVRP